MKRLIIFSLILCLHCSLGVAQNEKPARFSTNISLFSDIWSGNYENMTPRTINQGLDGYFMINIPVERSPLIFSVGTGIGSHNLYSDALLRLDSAGNYQFKKISEFSSTSTFDYKKSKLNVTYWDFPVEFRYHHKAGFRLALGMKFGFVLSSLTKYKGDDYIDSTNYIIKIKSKDVRNLEKWRYGFTARLGYKAIELYGYYSLTKIFKQDQGPDLFPISIGIALRPAFLESGK